MNSREYQQEKQLVLNWLQDFIVGYNLCPFAKKPLLNQQIRLAACAEKKRKLILETFIREIHHLDAHKETETTLLFFPDSLKDFYAYLEAIELCTDLLLAEGYEGIYQLASFHPDYLFEGEDPQDASHYTNRSPFPTIHIIREHSMEQVLKFYKNPEQIPENNIQKMRELGTEFLKSKLDSL